MARKNGKGTIKYSNGTFFEGQFSNNTPNGQGTMRYNDGIVYQGNFRDGIKDGKGKIFLIQAFLKALKENMMDCGSTMIKMDKES